MADPNDGNGTPNEQEQDEILLTQEQATSAIDYVLSSVDYSATPQLTDPLVVGAIQQGMGEFIEQYPEGISANAFIEQLNTVTLEALNLIAIPPNTEPEVADTLLLQNEQLAYKILEGASTGLFTESGVQLPPELLAQTGFDVQAFIGYFFSLPPDEQSTAWRQLSETQLAEVIAVFEQDNQILQNVDKGTREQYGILTSDSELEAFARAMSGALPGEQVFATEFLTEEEKSRLGELLTDDPTLLVSIDESAREALGITLSHEEVWQLFEDEMRGKEQGEQLQAAYMLLEGWDYDVQVARLERLNEVIAGMRTDFMGIPIPGMQFACQQYYNAMVQHNEALLVLKERTIIDEGEERGQVIEWLTWLNDGESKDSWQDKLLPDLAVELRRNVITQRGQEGFDDSAYDPRHEELEILAYLRKYEPGDPAFRLIGELLLFGASVFYEPIDWALTGFGIAKDIIKGEVNWWTGFDIATLLIPGALSQLNESFDNIKVISYAMKASESIPSGGTGEDVFQSAKESREWFRGRYPNINNETLLNNVNFTGASKLRVEAGMDEFARLYSSKYGAALSDMRDIRSVSNSRGGDIAKISETTKYGRRMVYGLSLYLDYWGAMEYEIDDVFVAISEGKIDFGAVIDHESGHAIERWLRNSGYGDEFDAGMRNFIGTYGEELKHMSPQVQRYAPLLQRGEYFSELFSASQMNNLSPNINNDMINEFSKWLDSIVDGIE